MRPCGPTWCPPVVVDRGRALRAHLLDAHVVYDVDGLAVGADAIDALVRGALDLLAQVLDDLVARRELARLAPKLDGDGEADVHDCLLCSTERARRSAPS